MSASVYVQPLKGERLSMGGPSSFMRLMERLGHTLPCEISDRDVGRLEVAADVVEDEEYARALRRIAELAYAHGSVRVWAEY